MCKTAVRSALPFFFLLFFFFGRGIPAIVMRKRVLKILLPQTTVTLKEGHGYSKWYQNEEFSCVYHYTMIERNQSVNVLTQPIFLPFFLKSNPLL